ncbi:hypothetical protein OHV05_34460 [Kitasatospora sp. NBC_00070]
MWTSRRTAAVRAGDRLGQGELMLALIALAVFCVVFRSRASAVPDAIVERLSG